MVRLFMEVSRLCNSDVFAKILGYTYLSNNNHCDDLKFISTDFRKRKFKFCGDGDCPLWALAGLHALSSLPSTLFTGLVTQVADDQTDDSIIEMLKNTNLNSRDECARAAAVIRWVLQQAWRNSCPAQQLSKDLLVLGVPRSHAAALAQAADEGRAAYNAAASSGGFMVNKLTDASVAPGPEGCIDTIKLSLDIENTFTGGHKTQGLLIDTTQAKELLSELKKAYARMEEVNQN